MREPIISARCAWCGGCWAGISCPACGHDLGRSPEMCRCPACLLRPPAPPLLLADSQYRDRAGAVACRIRVYAARAEPSAVSRAQPVILCTRLDRQDRRDGVVALGPAAVLAIAARHFGSIGRPDAPAIERFLWIEGNGARYTLLSFAPNREATGGLDGWRAAFGNVIRRIPLDPHEVVALTGDASLTP